MQAFPFSDASDVPFERIKLYIFDIDNTCIELFSQWGRISRELLNETGRIFGVEQKALLDGISIADPSIQRVHHFPLALQAALERNNNWSRASEKDRQAFMAATHKWYVSRDAGANLFPNVLGTWRSLRASGRAIAIHTDGTVLNALARFKAAGVPVELIDRLYAQPDAKLGDRAALQAYLRKSSDPYFHAFAGKVVPLAPRSQKHTDANNTALILKDFGVAPDRAMMVDDNICGAITASHAGVLFAWQEQGSRIDSQAIALIKAIRDQTRLGHEDVAADLVRFGATRDGFRMIRLPNGFADLMKMIHSPKHKKIEGEKPKEEDEPLADDLEDADEQPEFELDEKSGVEPETESMFGAEAEAAVSQAPVPAFARK
ncbi:hypothetical protein CWS72_23980 [Telmatospirillum siberiense]|uniref:HAD family hydrolase n=2 Tax=Telmatospirillum siberiense TaxID=382514 RepID=A0A2N3PNJ6_9PROT|nr:hypothetical protein CWS72_23980 [Telmatospirillum siberiense]